MNNKPMIKMYGEVDGDKRGIEIKGNGGHLYNGSFNVELHGVEMDGIAIKNDNESIANISDIKTNSSIVNTGRSSLTLKRAEIFLEKKKLGIITTIIIPVIASLIVAYLVYKFGWNK